MVDTPKPITSTPAELAADKQSAGVDALIELLNKNRENIRSVVLMVHACDGKELDTTGGKGPMAIVATNVFNFPGQLSFQPTAEVHGMTVRLAQMMDQVTSASRPSQLRFH